jgi:hypothetical protein
MHADYPVVVTYEDRIDGLIGVEVLARSLAMHAPLLKLIVYSPLKEMNNLSQSVNNIVYKHTEKLKGKGWNVKPSTLLWALEEYGRAIWFDTDIVISGDIQGIINRFSIKSIVVGQEFSGDKSKGGILRAQQWEFEVGRTIPFHVNSGSVLVSRHHIDLLQDWQSCLLEDKYLIHQNNPGIRPPGFVGDQDVLWALLVSSKYCNISVEYFKIGYDMLIHCGARGFQISDRIKNIVPHHTAFVHMLGKYKPWSFNDIPNKYNNKEAYRHAVCFELSPFHAACQPIASQLENQNWVHRRTPEAIIWNKLTFGNVALRGMPLALASLLKETLRL